MNHDALAFYITSMTLFFLGGGDNIPLETIPPYCPL